MINLDQTQSNLIKLDITQLNLIKFDHTNAEHINNFAAGLLDEFTILFVLLTSHMETLDTHLRVHFPKGYVLSEPIKAGMYKSHDFGPPGYLVPV